MALSIVIIAACSGPSGQDAAESTQIGLSDGEFTTIEGMEVRSDQQPISGEDRSVISAALTRLVAACMGREGFDYEEGLSPEAHVPSPPPYLSPEELDRSGYQYDWAAAAAAFVELNGPDGPPDPTAGMTPEEAAGFGRALLGPDDGEVVTLEDPGGGSTSSPVEGCLADAREGLFGSVANYIRFDRAGEALSHSGLRDALMRIPDYEQPLRAWQDCMRTVGFDVGAEVDYGAIWLQQQGAAALSQEGHGQTVVTADVIESVARADATCQESSRLYEVREQLLPEVRAQIASELGFEMNQYIAFQQAVLERAEQVP